MTALTIVKAAGAGAVEGFGGRIGRSVRDGCVFLTILQLHALLMVDHLPAAALGHIAMVFEGDASAPGAEEMLRVAAYGSFSLEAISTAPWIAGLSLILRVVLSAGSAGWHAARAPREAAHG